MVTNRAGSHPATNPPKQETDVSEDHEDVRHIFCTRLTLGVCNNPKFKPRSEIDAVVVMAAFDSVIKDTTGESHESNDCALPTAAATVT